MSEPTDKALRTRLERVAHELAGAEPGSARNRDFCFHMTDWADELRALAKLVNDPSAASDAQWEDVVLAFLIHASGHILAAAKIAQLQPIEFEIPDADQAGTNTGHRAEPAA